MAEKKKKETNKQREERMAKYREKRRLKAKEITANKKTLIKTEGVFLPPEDVPFTKADIDFDSLTESELIYIMKALYIDPIMFSELILHVTPDEQQQEVIRAVYDFPTKKVAVKAGRGSGKTYAASILILHFLCTRIQSQIYLTSASSATLSGSIWPTLSKLFDGMNPYFKNMFAFQSESIRHKMYHHNWFCIMRTSRPENPDALAGSHAKNMLYIADEASGISEESFRVIQGSLTEENNYLLMISNPRRLQGFFYNAFLPDKKHVFKQMTMTCLNSRWIKKAWIKDQQIIYGLDSDEYRVEVLGEFPRSETSSIITPEMMSEALDRTYNPKTIEGDIVWGLDVGAGRNKSVLVCRKGREIRNVKKWNYRDTMEVVGAVKKYYDDLTENERPIAIHVDSIGWGKGAFDRMRELELPVIKADAGQPAVQKKWIYNNKAEWSYRMRQWFLHEEPVFTEEAKDADLITQLPLVCQRISSDGRFTVEKKESFADRHPKIGSPDAYDALAMTFNLHGRKVVGLIA
jgi:phage terminase large subunit